MFTLIVVLLTMTNIYSHSIEKYPTLEECEAIKVKMVTNFQQAYPGTQDYIFACLKPVIVEE